MGPRSSFRLNCDPFLLYPSITEENRFALPRRVNQSLKVHSNEKLKFFVDPNHVRSRYCGHIAPLRSPLLPLPSRAYSLIHRSSTNIERTRKQARLLSPIIQPVDPGVHIRSGCILAVARILFPRILSSRRSCNGLRSPSTVNLVLRRYVLHSSSASDSWELFKPGFSVLHGAPASGKTPAQWCYVGCGAVWRSDPFEDFPRAFSKLAGSRGAASPWIISLN